MSEYQTQLKYMGSELYQKISAILSDAAYKSDTITNNPDNWLIVTTTRSNARYLRYQFPSSTVLSVEQIQDEKIERLPIKGKQLIIDTALTLELCLTIDQMTKSK